MSAAVRSDAEAWALVVAYHPYAIWKAQRLAARQRRTDVEDLVSEVQMAMFRAARTWRPDGGRSFRNWARWYIQAYVKKAPPARWLKCDDGSQSPRSLDERVGDDLRLHEVIPAPEQDVSTSHDGSVARDFALGQLGASRTDQAVRAWLTDPSDRTITDAAREHGLSRQAVFRRIVTIGQAWNRRPRPTPGVAG